MKEYYSEYEKLVDLKKLMPSKLLSKDIYKKIHENTAI